MPIIALEEWVYCCPYVHHHSNDIVFKQQDSWCSTIRYSIITHQFASCLLKSAKSTEILLNNEEMDYLVPYSMTYKFALSFGWIYILEIVDFLIHVNYLCVGFVWLFKNERENSEMIELATLMLRFRDSRIYFAAQKTAMLLHLIPPASFQCLNLNWATIFLSHRFHLIFYSSCYHYMLQTLS